MILLYQVGKWVAANFKSLSMKMLGLFFWRQAAHFYATAVADSSLRPRHFVPYYTYCAVFTPLTS